MKKEVATEHIQIKLTPSEFEQFKPLLEASGLKRATLFKKIVLGREIQVSQSKLTSPEKNRIVFLTNKTSNNINQIAKNINQAYRGGVVNEHLYIATLNNLISLEKLFAGALNKC